MIEEVQWIRINVQAPSPGSVSRTTDVKGGSRQYSVRDVAAHTALKFRQLGQNSVGEVSWSHLKVELLVAEEEALGLDQGEDYEEEDKDKSGASHVMEESEEQEGDDTDELLRELERIKRERAEEKGRQEREKSSSKAAAREVEIVTSNSFLNNKDVSGQFVNSPLRTEFKVYHRVRC
ncbi:hypothetical protein EDD16DRAFT_1696003 [Pisolithus croceorrhizus]|nr:hypothetical protein EDD16DRAFT_1696003 [Pisolithus croceorrhizus]